MTRPASSGPRPPRRSRGGKRVTFVARDPPSRRNEHHSSITYRRPSRAQRARPIGARTRFRSAHRRRGWRSCATCNGPRTLYTHSQIIVEMGRYPSTELFDERRLLSVNDGATEIASLIGPAAFAGRAPNGLSCTVSVTRSAAVLSMPPCWMLAVGAAVLIAPRECLMRHRGQAAVRTRTPSGWLVCRRDHHASTHFTIGADCKVLSGEHAYGTPSRARGGGSRIHVLDR